MATVTKPNTFVDGTPAEADDVNADFDTIYTHVNTEVVHRDGSIPMTGALVLVGDPASNLQAAPKQYVDAKIGAPAVSGFIGIWGGAGTPAGWLPCDGSAVSRTTYSALFAAIGTTHGAGNGSTTFNVPDLRGRAPMGAGSGPGLTARTAGQQVGDENLQQHAHVQNVLANPGTGPLNGRIDYDEDALGANAYNQGVTSEPAGAGNSQNIQPSTVVVFVIKA